ncbi:hypothetical protein SFUMM280S_07289 [Streptomyces fumanus]
MPSTPEDRHDFSAPRPVEAEPGALVHTTADRRLAIEQWLLSTHPSPRHARAEWIRHGVLVLPLGSLFSAIRVPGRLIQALAASTASDVDAFLADALDGAPVICDMQGPRYYLLVPASVPRTWHDAADDWPAAWIRAGAEFFDAVHEVLETRDQNVREAIERWTRQQEAEELSPQQQQLRNDPQALNGDIAQVLNGNGAQRPNGNGAQAATTPHRPPTPGTGQQRRRGR